MHPSAMRLGQAFFETYARFLPAGTLVDIGAQDVNGSLRSAAPAQHKYVGVDFAPGKGVDLVLKDPYQLPFADESVDGIVSSSCFEHSEMFWLLFLEGLRILKPAGLFYLNAPSNGPFHRYPVDCWRFYPDAGNALVTWARHNRYEPQLLESFVAEQQDEPWNDFVAVFVKDRKKAAAHPRRIVSVISEFTNGIVAGQAGFLKSRESPEDQARLLLIREIAARKIKFQVQ